MLILKSRSTVFQIADIVIRNKSLAIPWSNIIDEMENNQGFISQLIWAPTLSPKQTLLIFSDLRKGTTYTDALSPSVSDHFSFFFFPCEMNDLFTPITSPQPFSQTATPLIRPPTLPLMTTIMMMMTLIDKAILVLSWHDTFVDISCNLSVKLFLRTKANSHPHFSISWI